MSDLPNELKMDEEDMDEYRKQMPTVLTINEDEVRATFVRELEEEFTGGISVDEYPDVREAYWSISNQYQANWYVYELDEGTVGLEKGDRVLVTEAKVKPLR